MAGRNIRMDQFKRFHKSDTLIYEYSEVYIPLPHYSEGWTIKRSLKHVHASPQVTWAEIAAEARSYLTTSLGKSPNNPVLLTCVVDYPEFIVGLTCQGFHRLIGPFSGLYSDVDDYNERIEQLSKLLVANRDSALLGLHPSYPDMKTEVKW